MISTAMYTNTQRTDASPGAPAAAGPTGDVPGKRGAESAFEDPLMARVSIASSDQKPVRTEVAFEDHQAEDL